jgi:ABC-2 type transport system ATP-binding protein
LYARGAEVTRDPAIEAVGLTKSYGTVRALAGVDLRAMPGTVLALLGPNGAGKTTLVRVLATLTRPDSGTARVAGFDAVVEAHEVRRRISLTGQHAAVDDLQTGRENLTMLGRLRGLHPALARSRAEELLAIFDLTAAADRRVRTYSGGMRRRLDLAAGLVDRPDVLFLDEPTTGLDPQSRKAMWGIVRALTASGVTVLLTTQYLEEADQLADNIAVIDHGRIVARGRPDQLKRQVAPRRLEVVLAGASEFDVVSGSLGGRVLHANRAELTLGVAIGESAAEVRDLLDEIDPERRRILRFTQRGASLDDVFAALTGVSRFVAATEAGRG